jgi:hypothetical protein
MPDIDFVITWVDGNDPNWRAEKQRFQLTQDSDDRDIRYRDWNTLRYWFRAVENYAPWVNRVHFVTWGHIPAWLNVNNPKLHIVRHSDYIPSEYLPTFNSHPIELNLHRIPGLTEQFVYFNDDTFLNAPVKPTDFFRNGIPVDQLIFDVGYPSDNQISEITYNNYRLISKYVDKRKMLCRDARKIFYPLYGLPGLKNLFILPFPYFTGFYNHHLPISFTKTAFEQMWAQEYSAFDETCRHRFRTSSDISPWVIRYWNLAQGNVVPCSYRHGKIFEISSHNKKMYHALLHSRYKMICCNDGASDFDFDEVRSQLITVFETKLPKKSSFEI